MKFLICIRLSGFWTIFVGFSPLWWPYCKLPDPSPKVDRLIGVLLNRLGPFYGNIQNTTWQHKHLCLIIIYNHRINNQFFSNCDSVTYCEMFHFPYNGIIVSKYFYYLELMEQYRVFLLRCWIKDRVIVIVRTMFNNKAPRVKHYVLPASQAGKIQISNVIILYHWSKRYA